MRSNNLIIPKVLVPKLKALLLVILKDLSDSASDYKRFCRIDNKFKYDEYLYLLADMKNYSNCLGSDLSEPEVSYLESLLKSMILIRDHLIDRPYHHYHSIFKHFDLNCMFIKAILFDIHSLS